MKRSIWLVVTGILILLILPLWLVLSETEKEKPSIPTVTDVSLQSESNKTVAQQEKKQALKKIDEEQAPNPYESQVIKAQIQQVADIYAENIKYPLTSQPIYNPEDVREHKPFEQSEVTLPFPVDDDDANPIRISAATDTFQYFEGDTIVVQVRISGAPKGVAIQVNGIISGSNGDIPLKPEFTSNDHDLTQFTASFETTQAPSNRLTPEMLVKLNVVIGNRDLSTTVAFRYAIASARIVNVQQSKPEESELIIPLQLEVFQGGYYFVNGVLEDAASGRPLIQLQAESRLSQGEGLINLKAHIAALQRQGSEGPYILRNLRIYRGAAVGEDFDAPASSSQSQFNVNGFAFSDYVNEEYVDEQAQERLELLRDLGSVDNSGN